MGKNQAYKAMQRAKMSSQSATGGVDDVEDGMMDGSFHSPEWHAARLASLHTSHTVTWEEFKKRQKEEARKREELEDDEARMMKEYRAQLDAERASKLARGVNHTEKKRHSKGRKEKDKKRKRSEKKHRHRSVSETHSEMSSDDDKGGSSRKEKHKAKKEKRGKIHKSRRKSSPSSSDQTSSGGEEYGPVPLSSFFDNGKP